jgi:GntR family transcriptional repressor for pyruvate dehydrogenase complex
MVLDPAPLERRRLSDVLAQRLMELIKSGSYAAGEALPSILEIARRSRVSRGTVREALTRLEVLQLVEVRQGAGVFVRRPSAG